MSRVLRAARTFQIKRVSWIAQHGSWRLCREMGARLGLLNFALRRSYYQIGIDNLQRVLPDLSENEARAIIRRSVQNTEIMLLESLRLRSASPQEVRDYAHITGMEEFHREQERGKGVVLTALHLSNFEITGARLLQEFPLTTTSRPVDCRKTEEVLSEVRRKAGMEVLLPFQSASRLREVLRQGNTVGLFADHNGDEHEMVLPFFGYNRHIITTTFRLAAITGSSVMTSFAVRRSPWLSDGRLDIHLRPCPATAPSASGQERLTHQVQRFLNEVEEVVARFPDQWNIGMWMQLQGQEQSSPRHSPVASPDPSSIVAS